MEDSPITSLRSFPSTQLSQRTPTLSQFASGRTFPNLHGTPKKSRMSMSSTQRDATATQVVAMSAATAAAPHGALITEEKEEEDDGMEKCAICTYPLNDLAVLPCHHFYCLACICEWFQISTTCPLCKAATVELHHWNPPLVPQKVNALASMFLESSAPAAAAASSSSSSKSNDLTSFVARTVSYFHASNPGRQLEKLRLPVEQLASKPRLGLDGHEMDDHALAARLHAQQEYDAFVIGAEDSDEEEADVVCVFCNEPSQPEVLLLCDYCNLGYHTFCLDPPLARVPDGDWFCPDCIQQVEQEIREERATGRRASGLIGLNQFGGAPAGLRTPPPRRRGHHRPGTGSGSSEEQRSAERQRMSEGRRRIRIFVRRTLEMQEDEEKERSIEAWGMRRINPPSAAAASSSHGASSQLALMPHVGWGRHSHNDVNSTIQNELTSLFSRNAPAHYQPRRSRDNDEDDDEDAASEVSYDSYGRERSPKSRNTSKNRSRTANEERKGQEDSEEEVQVIGERTAIRRGTVAKESTKKRKEPASTKRREDGKRTSKSDKSSKAASSKRQKKRRRRSSDEEDSDLDGFVDDRVLPATPSSDEDGTKAAFLPSQPNNKRSRTTKLAEKARSKVHLATAEAIEKHRERVLHGKRRDSSSSSDSRSSSSSSDSDDDFLDDEEVGQRKERSSRRRPKENSARTSKRQRCEPKASVKPTSKTVSSHRLAAEKSKPQEVSIKQSFIDSQRRRRPSHLSYEEDEDDISSFSASQERHQQKFARGVPLSSLDGLRSPDGVANGRPALATAASAAQRSLTSNGSGRKSAASTSSSYKLPLQPVRSGSGSKRAAAAAVREPVSGAEDEDGEAEAYASEEDEFDFDRELERRRSSQQRSPSPPSSQPSSQGASRKSFKKQSVAGGRSSTPTFHTPAASSRRPSGALDKSFTIPETPEVLEDAIPRSTPSSPVPMHPQTPINLVSPGVPLPKARTSFTASPHYHQTNRERLQQQQHQPAVRATKQLQNGFPASTHRPTY
jgi:hypothetical protein